MEADDGKLTGYTPQLLEAFIDEVIELHPDALVLGGDVTFNGEKQSHIDLSERLRRVQDAGVQVLMMPGNHDLSKSQVVKRCMVTSIFYFPEKFNIKPWPPAKYWL